MGNRIGTQVVQPAAELGKNVVDAANTQAGKLIWGAAMQQKRHPNPSAQHRIEPHSIEPSAAPRPDFHVLSPFDVWESRFPVVVQYIFPAGQSPDVARLVDSLSHLLAKYPALGGRFHKDGRQRVVARYAQPEVMLIVGPEEDCEIYAWRRGTFKEHLVASVACGMPISEGTPLFEARFTPVRGGGALLSVCVSHGLVDMQSCQQFVADWGRLARGAPVDPGHEQKNSNLILGQVEEFDPDAVENLGWRDSPFLSWIASMGLETLIGEATARAFAFTPEDVSSLKKLVMEGSAWKTFQERGYRLSAHDVLTALLWRSLAQVHPYHPDEQWDLVVVVNWRGRSELVPLDYFGNATTSPSAFRSMREIVHEMDFSQCALCVRELSAVSSDGLKDIVAFHNHLQYGGAEEDGLDRFVNVGVPMITNGCGLYISNFSKFDLYDADFGTGRPEIVRFQQPPIPGMCFAYPEESGKNLTLVVSMSRWDSGRLTGLDCKTGQAIVSEEPPKLKRPFCGRKPWHLCHDVGKSIRKVGRVSRGGHEHGSYRFFDFTRGVYTLAVGGLPDTSPSSERAADVSPSQVDSAFAQAERQAAEGGAQPNQSTIQMAAAGETPQAAEAAQVAGGEQQADATVELAAAQAAPTAAQAQPGVVAD